MEISHLVEHLVFRGNDKRTLSDSPDLMDMEGNYYNAFTTLNRTEYILESTGENLLPALSCFLDLILEPAFDPAEVAIEKKIVTVEKALRDTPGNLFLTYLNHLTQNQLTSKIEAIDRRHVLAFHRQHYTVDQLTVIITGNFEAAEIAAYLAALPKPQTPDPRPQTPAAPKPPLAPPAAIKADLVLEDYLPGTKYRLLFGFNLGAIEGKDLTIAKILPSILLFESRHHQLWLRLRQELGYSYDLRVDYSYLSEPTAPTITIGFQVLPENTGPALDAVFGVLLDLGLGYQLLPATIRWDNNYFPISLGVIGGILWLQRARPLPLDQWHPILFQKKILNLALQMSMIRVYGAFIQAKLPDGSTLVASFSTELTSDGIPIVLKVMLIPFVSALATGLALGYVGASFPIIISLLGPSPSLGTLLAHLVLAQGFGMIGIMLSPVHVCHLVSNEYFETELSHTIRLLLTPSALVLSGAIGLYLLYSLFF